MRQQLKAYKSLEAYKQFVDGWVGDVTIRRVPSTLHTCVINARVRHSQRIYATPVHAWVPLEQGGVVLCAHCTCMAGLGEACFHMAAILITLDANTRTKLSTCCTSLPCSWLPPTLSNVPYRQIADIDFSTPAQKRRKTRNKSSSQSADQSLSVSCSLTDCAPSPIELDQLYMELSKSGNLYYFPSFLATAKLLYHYASRVCYQSH